MYAKFFGKQKLCADEKELALMVDTMKTDLPASFRVTGFRSQATAVRNVIEGTYFKELADIAAGTGTEIKTEGKVSTVLSIVVNYRVGMVVGYWVGLTDLGVPP